MEILTREITSKKVRGSKVDFSAIKISSKKVRGNNVDFSTIEITSKRVRGNNVDFSTIEITSKRVRGSNVDFSTIEITLTKVSGSNVDFSISEITLKKVSGSNVDFSVSEITSKKYVEMTWKFVEIWSSMYRRNIHVESTWIWHGRRPRGIFTLLKEKFSCTFEMIVAPLSCHNCYCKIMLSFCQEKKKECCTPNCLCWKSQNNLH